MTAVAVYLVVVVAFAAVCCGHHGETFPIPLRGAWRGVAGALAASRALRGLDARPDRYRPQRPSWAAAPSGVGEAP